MAITVQRNLSVMRHYIEIVWCSAAPADGIPLRIDVGLGNQLSIRVPPCAHQYLPMNASINGVNWSASMYHGVFDNVEILDVLRRRIGSLKTGISAETCLLM